MAKFTPPTNASEPGATSTPRMKLSPRQWMLAALGLLMVLNGVAGWHLAQAVVQHHAAQANLQRGQALAGQILSAKQDPVPIATEALQTVALAGVLEQCAQTAGIASTIAPMPKYGGSRPPSTKTNLTEATSTNGTFGGGASGGGGGYLDRVWPEPPRRVGGTDFQVQVTQVALHGVRWRQVVMFLDQLAQQAPLLTVRALHVTAPRGEESGDLWNADLELAYYLEAPADSRGLNTNP